MRSQYKLGKGRPIPSVVWRRLVKHRECISNLCKVQMESSNELKVLSIEIKSERNTYLTGVKG